MLKRSIPLAIITVLLFAVGAGRLAMVAVGASGSGGGEAFTDTEKKPAQDLDAGLSAQEKDAKYRALSDAHFSRLAAWLPGFASSGVDVRSLRQTELLAVMPEGASSLAEAVRGAEVILEVRATSIRFGTMSGYFIDAEVDLEVLSTLKGPKSERVTVVVPAALQPGSDWSYAGATLAVTDSTPVLMPGDRAVVFLVSAGGGRLTPQSVTGTYRLGSDGKVTPTEDNAFASEVRGLSIGAWKRAIQAQVSAPRAKD